MSFNGFTVASEVEIFPECHPDGVSDNTTALQAAIDRAAAVGNESCQGVVVLEPGVWRTGPLELKSYVTLRFSAQTTLEALPEKGFVSAYIGAPSQPHEALIHAHGVTRCAIEGPEGLGEPNAVIDGTGEHWWPAAIEARGWLKNGEVERFTQAFPGIVTANGMPRPWLIELSWCSQVKMSGIKLTHSPMWTLVVRNSNQVLLEGLWVINPEYAPNTDGIDLVSSRDVTVRGCYVDTGDDNIAIKSGIKQDGAPRCEDVFISECSFGQGHGLSIGSETANGIGAINIANVVFKGTGTGIRIKSARDRGNHIGPMHARDITMQDVETAILLTCSYAGQSGVGDAVMDSLVAPLEAAAPSATTPYIKDITIENLKARNVKYGVVLSGLPEAKLEQLTLKHLEVESQYGLAARYVQGAFCDCKISAKLGAPLRFGPECAIAQD